MRTIFEIDPEIRKKTWKVYALGDRYQGEIIQHFKDFFEFVGQAGRSFPLFSSFEDCIERLEMMFGEKYEEDQR